MVGTAGGGSGLVGVAGGGNGLVGAAWGGNWLVGVARGGSGLMGEQRQKQNIPCTVSHLRMSSSNLHLTVGTISKQFLDR